MDVLGLRSLVLDVNLSVYGLDVTVTLPGEAPIATQGIWQTPVRTAANDQIRDVTGASDRGGDWWQSDPRRKVLGLPRTDLPTPAVGAPVVPLGTQIAAPEIQGGTVLSWVVEGTEREEAEHVRVIVVPK